MYKTIFGLKAATLYNTFLYYLQRIPLLGKLISDSAYKETGLKTLLLIFAGLISFLKGLFYKTLYFLSILAFPIFLMYDNSELAGALFEGDTLHNSLNIITHILIVMSCIGGPLLKSVVLTPTRERYIAIKFLRMPPDTYMRTALPIEYIKFGVAFLPLMALCLLFFGASALQIAAMCLLIMATRFAGDALTLLVYSKIGKNLPVWPLFATIFGTLCFCAAYAPPLFGWPMLGIAAATNPVVVAVVTVLGLASVYYLFNKKRSYGTSVTKTLTTASVTKKSTSAATFRDVAMQESDIEISQKNSASLQSKTGYAYLNALFFARNQRQLWRPVLIRLGIVGGILVICLGLIIFAPAAAKPAISNLLGTLPIFVFVMYFISVSPKACRALFYNCDISLLRYSFYREPQAILKNFTIRLRYIAFYDFISGAAIAASVFFLLALCGKPVTLQSFVFVATIMLLSVFFSVHNLFMYYIFQPYSTELDIKNPFFKIINGIMYVLCYTSLQIKNTGWGFTLGVLIGIIVYMLAALVLVYKFAPKTFRVK